jgi:hypothetical protein
MHWRFWIAFCGILLSIGFVIGFTTALLYMRDAAAITFSVSIALAVSVASAVISGVGLFQTWNKNRKEEERIPALAFDGFVKTKGTITLPPGPRSAFIVSSTYSVRVKKTKGKIGRAEQCDGFISLIGLLAFDIHSRWLPDYLVECDIGDCMNLVLFHTILETRQSATIDATEVIFLHASTHHNDHDETIPLRLINYQSQLLNIRVGSRNAETPRPLQKTIKQIMDEARTFS